MKKYIIIQFRKWSIYFISTVCFHGHSHAEQYILKDIEWDIYDEIEFLELNILAQIICHNIQKEGAWKVNKEGNNYPKIECRIDQEIIDSFYLGEKIVNAQNNDYDRFDTWGKRIKCLHFIDVKKINKRKN